MRDVNPLLLQGVEDRCRGLSTIYNLKIAEPLKDGVPVSTGLKLDFRRRAAEAIVICEKSMRLLAQCLLEASVDLAARLQKRANVTLKQSLSMFAIDPRQKRRSEERQEGAVFPRAIRHLQARNRAAVV